MAVQVSLIAGRSRHVPTQTIIQRLDLFGNDRLHTRLCRDDGKIAGVGIGSSWATREPVLPSSIGFTPDQDPSSAWFRTSKTEKLSCLPIKQGV